MVRSVDPAWAAHACCAQGQGALGCGPPLSGARRRTVPKGQEKAKKDNKPKLSTKEKQEKKKKAKEEKKK